jgi:Glycosyltransferase family 87
MDGRLVRGPDNSRSGSLADEKRLRYDGIGWPRSIAEVRVWIPGTVVLVALTIWGYVAIGPNGRLEPGRTELHKTDFTVFTEAGAAFFDGRDPYRVTNARGWHYLYPPLFALMVAPLSIFDTATQVVTWYVVNVLLSLGCLWEARGLWRFVSGSASNRILWVAGCALVAGFLPFLDCMQSGQLGIAILYFLMLGSRLVIQGQSRLSWFLGGLVLALPAVVPSLPVAFLLCQRWSAVVKPRTGPRTWAQATSLTAGLSAGFLLFVLAIPASLVGWRANLDYLSEWHLRVVTNERVGADKNFNIHSYRNQSLANAAYLCEKSIAARWAPQSRANHSPDRPERIVHAEVRILIGLILAALLLIGCLLGRQTDALDQATAFGLACCSTLLVSPLSWGHYYMAQTPAALLCPIWLLQRGRPVQARIVAVAPPVLAWSHYLAMPYLGELGLLGLGTTVWFLGVCVLIVGNEVAVASGRRVRPCPALVTTNQHINLLTRPVHAR